MQISTPSQAMDSNLNKLCRLCIQISDDVVNIWETFHDSPIASILAKHFWFEVNKGDGLTESLCQICWMQIRTFHEFYKKVEHYQKTFWDSIEKECEAEERSLELDLSNCKSDESDLTLVEIIDSDYNYDQNETGQTSDDEEQTSIEQTIYDKGKKVKQNDRIRELFTMNCDFCSDVEFEDLPGARKHYRSVHHMQGYLVCCGKQFFLLAEVLDHIRDHNASLRTKKHHARIRELFTMKCNICTNDVKFENLLEARRHYRTVHKMKGYLICCGKKFFHSNTVNQHVFLHNNPDTIEQNAKIRELFNMRCDICSDAEFEDLIGARRHYRKVHNTRAYLICCDKKFWRRHTILQHVQSHINPTAYQCHTCSKTFPNKYLLQNHLGTHIPITERTLKCSLCPSSFQNKHKLKSHVENTHNSKTGENFPCEKCNKNFRSKLLVTQHNRFVHKDSLDHVCEICANRYKTKTQLVTHIERQHSTKPQPKVQCSICGVWLKHKVCLVKHVRSQHQETREIRQCPKCEKEVKGERALRNHLLQVHAERRYQCVMCGKSFKKALTLKEHMAGHTGDYLYNCQYCKKKFNSNANLYSHRKKVHLAEWKRDNAKRAIDEETGLPKQNE